MKKEEYLADKANKTGLKAKELEELWDKFEEEGKDMNVSVDIERYVRFRMNQHLLRLEREPTVKATFTPLAVEKTDYNARRDYIKAKTAWDDNEEEAVSKGLCNSQGEPLYQSGFNKGKPINLDESLTKTFMGYMEIDGKQMKGYYKAGGLLADKVSMELGNQYEIIGIKSQKSTATELVVIAREANEPKLAVKMSYDKKLETMKEYFAGCLTSIKKLPEFYEERKEQRPVIAAVKGDVLSMRVNQNKQDKGVEIEVNNILEIMDETGSEYLTCWVPKIPELDFNFTEKSMDLIVVGRLSKREKQGEPVTYSITPHAIYVRDEFKKKETDADIGGQKEVDDEDVDEFLGKPKKEE